MSLTLSAESVAVEEGPCTSERRAVDDEFMAVHTCARGGEGGARGRGGVCVLRSTKHETKACIRSHTSGTASFKSSWYLG
jgi:hypothetical protein